MNRPIEFRGMCINGAWVYGNLSVLTKKYNDVPAGYYISNSGGAPFAYDVRPETVGQFTGLLDKNGVKIFEGDILRHTMFDKHSYTVVEFKKHSMNYTSGHGSSDNFIVYGYHCDVWFDFDHYEVVGNIFESPELLEEK